MRNLPPTHKFESVDLLNQDQKNSFVNVSAVRAVMLEPGDEIHRFVKNYNKLFSDCWISRDTFQKLFAVFTTWEQTPERIKTQHLKNSLSVLEEWNTFEFRTKVILSKEVVGYVGITGPQKMMVPIENTKDKRSVEFRLGGFEQIIIPRFKSVQNSEGVDYSTRIFKQRVWNLNK